MKSGKTVKTAAVGVLVLVWLAIAAALGSAGVFKNLRPPVPQVMTAVLGGSLLFLVYQYDSFRRWVFTVDERVLIAPHLLRFVGAHFIVLFELGELPYKFAVPGGWGDIGVAFFALILISTTSTKSIGGWTAYFIWNLAGLFEIVFVVGTAARLGIQDPQSMHKLQVMPLCLLPSWLVPIIIATHMCLFIRLLLKIPR